MRGAEYWIWLARCLGAGARIDEMLLYFGSPEALYAAGSREWRLSGLLTNRQIAALTKFSPSQSGDIMHSCRENGWSIVTPDDIEYPERLRSLPNYPAVLYAWGNLTALNTAVSVAVVGTRRASDYGLKVTRALSGALSKAGAMIVSGGALGIDSAAHTGALEAHGGTVAVLGCGLGYDYLQENRALRNEISHNGAVISEYAPFTPASRTTFPMRNRIISGMTLGTVVIEAGERSGSLITARLALEQGRDVFAVPGDVISSAYTGANKLIHDGAKPVFTALDVLEEYKYLYPDKLNIKGADVPLGKLLDLGNAPKIEPPKPPKPEASPKANAMKATKEAKEAKGVPVSPKKPDLPRGLSKEAERVFAAMGTEPLHIDELSERTGYSVQGALAALTELELFGVVCLTEGRKYTIINS